MTRTVQPYRGSDAGGVALMERLVTEAGSPLYGEQERALRDALSQVRYRLLCGVSPIDRGGLRG